MPEFLFEPKSLAAATPDKVAHLGLDHTLDLAPFLHLVV